MSMIGPHQGKELDLMLAGTKALAVFHDALIPEQDISEEIIPERAFAPYVADGIFKRFSEDVFSAKGNGLVRFVCFTLPDHEWRAQFLLWLNREIFSGRMAYDSSYERIIGHLLGYGLEDVGEFIERRKKFSRG